MTVTASTTRNDYTAGSAQNVYSYTFQLNEATDVDVYLDGVLQTLNTHYTVQNVGNSTGGTITFTLVDAENNPIYPTEGAVINILMAMDLDRDTAYQPSGAFLAADVNNDFDRLWLASNQQQTEINRTLRLQDTDITTANMELPQNSTRRNKLLGFNNDGNPVAVTNNQINWDVAYDNMIVSTSFTDGNYTLTQQDGDTFTNNFDGRYFQNTGGNIYGGIDVNGAITSTGNLNITGTITASGYNNTNWDSAYNKKITSVDYSVGTNTLTLEQQDGNSLTTTISGISDIALSYNGVVKAEAVATGVDITGNVSLDDNGKALFGDGNDLQIYHDGSNSYIHDTGTGGLYIRGSDEIALRSSSNENIFLGLTDGSAYVYHDGDVRLQTTSSGIDVTGRVTADNLTVDGGGVFQGTSTQIDLIETDVTGNNTRLRQTVGDFFIQTVDNSSANPVSRFNLDHATGDISFYEDTGTTPKFFWDASSERLGIGTTAPGSALTVKSSSFSQLRLEDDDDHLEIGYSLASAYIKTGDNDTTINFRKTNNTDVMTVDMATERVGIGTTSPANTLTVGNLTASAIDQDATVGIKCNTDHKGLILQENSGAEQWSMGVNADGDLNFYDSAVTDPLVTFQDTSGNIGIGTDSPTYPLDIAGASGTTLSVRNTSTVSSILLSNGSSANQIFSRGANSSTGRDLAFVQGTSEAMRIDSSGNVGIGTTSPNDKFHVANGSTGAGYLRIANNEGYARLGTDGGNLLLDVGGSEKMRIDSSGNVLVGKTSDSINTAGGQLNADGLLVATRDGGNTAVFNRKTSDGDLVQFRKDNTIVGSIGVFTPGFSESDLTINPEKGVLKIAHDDTFAGIKFSDSTTSDGFVSYEPRIGAEGNDLFLKTGLGIGRKRLGIEENGDISFYEDTGTTPKLFWDASEESLGIGTTTPASELDVNGTITADNVKLDNTNIQPSYNYTQQLFAGYQALGTSTQAQIGPSFYLRNYNNTFYKRYIEVVNDLQYGSLTNTNDLNMRLSLYVPTGASSVNIGTVDSITTTALYNRDIVVEGDVTHWFSDYSGVGANSNGTSAFPSIVSSSYDPTTDKTTFNASVYGATIPSVGDSIYVHPFDWENAGTELIGVTKQLDENSQNSVSKSISTKVYLGNIDRVAVCALKLYESSSDNVILSRSRVYQTDERA